MAFGALLVGGKAGVFFVQFAVVGFQVVLGELDGTDQIVPVRAVARDRPRRQSGAAQPGRQPDRAGHLAEVTVAEHDHGIAADEAQFHRAHRKVEHFLRRSRREHNRVGVAVAKPAAGELDVGLLRPEVAKPGTAAHEVDEHTGHLRADHVADSLEHETEARPAGERDGRHPRAAGTIHHIDRRRLTDGLHKMAANLRQNLCHQLRPFRAGGYRIAEDVPHAGEQGADGRGVGALEHERSAVGARHEFVGLVARRGIIDDLGPEQPGGIL